MIDLTKAPANAAEQWELEFKMTMDHAHALKRAIAFHSAEIKHLALQMRADYLRAKAGMPPKFEFVPG